MVKAREGFLHQKQNEKSVVLKSRKRRLTDLYVVALHPQSIANLTPKTLEEDARGLARFLDKNDIQSYFDEATLPSGQKGDGTVEDGVQVAEKLQGPSPATPSLHAATPVALNGRLQHPRLAELKELSGMSTPLSQPSPSTASAKSQQDEAHLISPLDLPWSAHTDNVRYIPRLLHPPHSSKPSLPLVAIQYDIQAHPIGPLLQSAHKATTTDYWYQGIEEYTDRQALARIDQLRKEGSWSLRQLKHVIEPPRPRVHWDYLLDECRWMARDFRQERRWKIAAAKQCADAVLEWWNAEDRSTLMVAAPRSPRLPSKAANGIVDGDEDAAMEATPPLEAVRPSDVLRNGPADASTVDGVAVPTGDNATDTFNERHPVHCDNLFDLPFSSITFSFLSSTSSASQIFSQLPLYEGLQPPRATEHHAQAPLIPISRFLHLPAVVKERPRKRLKLEDTDKETQHFAYRPGIVSFGPAKDVSPGRKRALLIYPPKAPPLSYIESRHNSQWTTEDDDLLLQLSREFSYNFDIVADYLSPRTRFSPISERRTPWECFERWHSIDPAANGATFLGPQVKLVQQRMEARKNKGPTRVESKRRGKCVAMFETMRKVFKKRELAQKPSSAPPKKLQPSTETNRPPVPTPLELIRLKGDRDSKQQMYERSAAAMAAMQAQRSGGAQPRASSSPGTQPGSNPAATDALAAAATAQKAGQNRGGGAGGANARSQTSPAAGRAVPANRLTPEQINALMAMQRNSALLRQQQQQQLQQQGGNQSLGSNPAFLALLQQAQQQNQALGVNGMKANGDVNGAHATPQGGAGQAGIGPTIAAITAHISREHPDLDQQQVAKIAQAQFAKYITTMQQQAAAAASSGNALPAGMNGAANPASTQAMLQQVMRAQQQSAVRSGTPNSSSGRDKSQTPQSTT